MITEPLFFLCAIAAVLIAGIGKGGFGGGTVVVALPLLSLVVPPVQAAAIMLPILCLMDLLSLWAYRGVYDRRNLKILLPAGLIGVGLGSLSFNVLADVYIKLMVGFLAILFSVNYWLMKFLPRSQATCSGSLLYGGFWGALSGFTSFSVHAGGPPLNIYLLPQKLHKTVFLGTIVIFFAVVNYVKLVPYAWLGLLDTSNLLTSLSLVLLAPLGVYLGMRLHRRLDETWFYRCCYVLLLLTGGQLCYEGTVELLDRTPG